MISGNAVSLEGALHLAISPGQPGRTCVYSLPVALIPSSQVPLTLNFIDNDSDVISLADQAGDRGSVDTAGGVWVGSPNEAITDVYGNAGGSPIQWTR
jgi:hypothetical protein